MEEKIELAPIAFVDCLLHHVESHIAVCVTNSYLDVTFARTVW
jgi:hypothetical protein